MRENYSITFKNSKYIYGTTLKVVDICWIRISSHPYWKIMCSILIQTIFHDYKKIINLISFLLAQSFILYLRKAVYNRMQWITIILLIKIYIISFTFKIAIEHSFLKKNYSLYWAKWEIWQISFFGYSPFCGNAP